MALRTYVGPQGPTYIKKKFDFGGERGIRTLDTFPYTHFPGVRLQPLGPLSKRRRVYLRVKKSKDQYPLFIDFLLLQAYSVAFFLLIVRMFFS